MSRMFGERIHEFVLSVDIMTEETFRDLLALIGKYIRGQLEVTYFSILEETTINEQKGLKTYWTTRNDEPSYTVDDGNDYASHSALTFAENMPIWVVSASRSPLAEATDCADLWRNCAELPRYSARSGSEVRTSVMHPLRNRTGRATGVVEFASEHYIEPTRASLEEVGNLAIVISRAYQMFDASRLQRENTREALKRLEDSMESLSWTRLALPQMFVAFAGASRTDEAARAGHEQVIEVIRSVISEFEHVVKALYWDKVEEGGNITEQVIGQIGESEFGLCYFSEPGPEGEYFDNPNVLFEAGMMQALTRSGSSLLRGWIPLREVVSPELPFDIAAERMLHVHRGEDGQLEPTALADALRARLRKLVATLDMET